MNRWLATLLVVASACKPQAKPAATAIAGTAVLIAPIANAHVRVTMLTADGPELVGESTTDDEGNFQVELFAARGTILVEVLGDRGGTTNEPVSGKPLQLSYTDRFTNLMDGVGLGVDVQGVVISPWSTLVSSRALWDIEANKTAPDKALLDAVSLFRDHFGGLEFLSSIPLDPSLGATNGLSSPAVHGFVTTGLTVAGNDLARQLRLSEGNLINTVSITQWLADDLLADGVFDGKGKKGPIVIVEDTTLDLEMSRALLGASLGTFLTSAKNQSGVALADLTALINAITSDTSILYGLKPSIAVSEGDGPRITITSPITNSTLRNQVIITGKAESNAGVAGVEIFLDKNLVSGGDRVSVNQVTWAINSSLTDGFHVLEVRARDSTGVNSSLTVTFQSDGTPPVIKFGFCLSYNDKQRSPAPIYNEFEQRFDWQTAPPPAQDCTQDALASDNPVYLFHTFAELAKSPSTSSRIAFVPEETGPITTAQADIIFEASVWKGANRVGDLARVKAKPNESAREVAISSDLFGTAILNVSPRDKLELRVTAVDAQGNETSQSYFFAVDFLPAPLLVKEATPATSSTERIEHYTFAANNTTQLFDPGVTLPYGILVAKRYAVTNPSDRAVALRLSLSPSVQPSATYAEWVGLVAGERTGAGTDRQVDSAATPGELENISVPVRFGSCYNEEPTDYINRSSLPANPKVFAVEDGSSSCITANDLLTEMPVATATSTWAYRVHTPSGELRFAQGGDYTIQPGETLQVSIGFPKPMFPARTISACVPNLRLTNYVSHTGGRNSNYYELDGHSPETFVATAGLFASVRRLAQYGSGGAAWDGLGWTDCSGVSCSGAGCRVAGQNEYLLRVSAAQGSADYCFDPNCSTCGPTNCQRQVWREWHELALSRVTAPYKFALSGSTSITTSSRLTTNPDTNDPLFTLLSESYSVQHSDKIGRSVPSNFETVVYTKGTLP